MRHAADPDPCRERGIPAIEEALGALDLRDPVKRSILELRFFCGLSVERTAELLGISEQAVGREQRFAFAWLRRELEKRGAAAHADTEAEPAPGQSVSMRSTSRSTS